MSIDAVIIDTRQQTDGSAELLLRDADGGRRTLACAKTYVDVPALVGCHVWGGSDSLMIGDVKVAERQGHVAIRFLDREVVDRAVREAKARQGTFPDVPTRVIRGFLTEAEMFKPNWQRFTGFEARHEFKLYTFGPNRTRRAGSVRFGEHIGKPLSDKLWEDLVCRLAPGCLEIYREGQEIKTIGRQNTVIIHLTLQNVVRDIEWFPTLFGV